jgi:hypothetical protein
MDAFNNFASSSSDLVDSSAMGRDLDGCSILFLNFVEELTVSLPILVWLQMNHLRTYNDQVATTSHIVRAPQAQPDAFQLEPSHHAIDIDTDGLSSSSNLFGGSMQLATTNTPGQSIEAASGTFGSNTPAPTSFTGFASAGGNGPSAFGHSTIGTNPFASTVPTFAVSMAATAAATGQPNPTASTSGLQDAHPAGELRGENVRENVGEYIGTPR